MYVVVQHQISDPEVAWAIAGEALASLPADASRVSSFKKVSAVAGMGD
jgi:hypothetical protein